ncbi:DivIVA domain-containing protein [Arthrobacter sp. SLBN-112]|uniref:DivIVA domain-containing protein n=1 Tax=Arthrobacter sp. SLBN-112 TaxID=2768452 RepID=UPI0027AF122D|nr:DivIVA domain-containing protein [Arthrobacter sp. SLBN-112]MDQ0800522.1 DivIVA domain-containing protein [Arthrobacter sp. SLBN-112]
MSFFLVFLAVILVAAVLWAGLGRRSRGSGGAGLPSLLGGGLEDPPANLPPVLLPAHAGPEDVNQLRFSLGLRGYRMDQVDQVLEDLRDQLAVRNREVAELRSRLAAMEQGVPDQDSDDGTQDSDDGTQDSDVGPGTPADPARIDPGAATGGAAEAHGTAVPGAGGL